MTTEYGKTVKKKLIDMDKTQAWLIERIKEKTGLYMDSSYMGKIYRGENHPKKVIAAINEVLGIR
jgi:hypothetical protein